MQDCIDHGLVGNAGGYGYIRIDGKAAVGVHRYAYCFNRGISLDHIKGLVIRHTCDNSRCINSKHLVIGKQSDNMADMAERGRSPSGVDHWSSTLSTDQIESIKSEYVYNSRSHGSTALAIKYGVCSATIRNIVKGVTHAKECVPFKI